MAYASDYDYGYNAKGIDTLVAEVNSIVMNGAANMAVDKVKDIKSVCNQYWDGQAKENFVSNFEKDAKLFKTNLKKLKEAFEDEIQNAGRSFQDFDKNLIEKK